MAASPEQNKVAWYKSPVPRETMAALVQRSDWKGLAQAGGHLGLLALSGAAAWYAVGLPLAVGAAAAVRPRHDVRLPGAGFHELVHQTVFKSKRLNASFST